MKSKKHLALKISKIYFDEFSFAKFYDKIIKSVMSKFPSGVITGDGVQAVFNDAQENEYALPAVNVVGTNSVNAVLETAAAVNSPVMVQFSNGGGSFFAGKSLDNADQKSATAGSVSGAMHVHQMAELYGVPVLSLIHI